ncbi:Aminotransferase class V-fold PLP-dependent enzyme [Planctomycetales bacterium 10988]|nr:Aminotransferase class V-fold PLP-dependent enzyme [Planctomycetales bacterium 10988]
MLAALNFAYADHSWGRYEGPNCEIFRQQLADYHDVEFVMLTQSGTFAVELALRGCHIGPGDEVILAGYDFGGNFAAIEAVGALPVLVDVDEGNWNLDPRQLTQAITDKTKAIIASCLHGGVIPMREVRSIADEHGLLLVEDACQMPGGIVEGRTAGTWGDVGILSFGGSKLLTSGRGGAVFTNSEEVFQRMKIYMNRGNNAFPLSELQAAVLRPQLGKLDKRNALRHASAEKLLPQLKRLPGLRPLVNRVRKTVPGYYKVGIRYVPEELGGLSREEFVAIIREEGVDLGAGFRGFGRRSETRCRRVGDLTQSRLAGRLMLVLHHPILLEEQEALDHVVQAFRKVTQVFASDQSEPSQDRDLLEEVDFEEMELDQGDHS